MRWRLVIVTEGADVTTYPGTFLVVGPEGGKRRVVAARTDLQRPHREMTLRAIRMYTDRMVLYGQDEGGGNVMWALQMESDSAGEAAAHESAEAVESERYVALKPRFSGDPCTECGAFALVRTGACQTCTACGASGGCG